MVSQGGFPQFLLPPVNFDALYAANQTQPQGATNWLAGRAVRNPVAVLGASYLGHGARRAVRARRPAGALWAAMPAQLATSRGAAAMHATFDGVRLPALA